MQIDEQRTVLESRRKQLNDLVEKMGADPANDGYFWVTAPQDGYILNADFRETLTNRDVKASEPLLRIGRLDKRWEIKLQIPQKHIGQVLRAFPPDNPKAELDVDLLVLSQPTRTYKGKLARDKIAAEANVNRDEGSNDAEPLITAWVRIDGPGIAEQDQLPRDLLKAAGTEVHAKIRCGDHALGYSLFYGVWEFFYEKIVFFF